MINFKQIIANKISNVTNLSEKELETYIETPKDLKNGDYAFPCFKLAKELKKAPPIIANEIKEKLEQEIEQNKELENIDAIGGYLNFFINKEILIKEVLEEISNEQKYGKSELGKGKNIIVEYSAPNIAKPFHIGHLRTTLIGNALYKIYKYLGYNTIGINHLGDYGTQFGKMIEAYKMWGSDYDLSNDPINKMMDMYVRINNLCKEDEQVLEKCRENFRLLEEGDKFCINLWKQFKDLSMIEFNKIYDILNVKFDSYNGEAFYADKTDEVIKILEEKGKLTESEGAKIVDLEYAGINTPCIIQKSNGSSIYAIRDLAAIMYRAKTYEFDKCLYVVAYEQNLHFKQIFEVAKYLVDEKYAKGLEHISEKNPELENKENIAKKVGIGAIIFNTLSTANIKDQVFDWNAALNFQGETGPYIQYMYVRTESVLKKVEFIPKVENVKIENLLDEYSLEVLKLIYNFEDILIQVTERNEPSILTKYLIDLAKAYSSFYNENKIIVDDKDIQNARIYLTYSVGKVLKQGANLLGIEMPEKM